MAPLDQKAEVAANAAEFPCDAFGTCPPPQSASWNTTIGYEQLLSIQQHQHVLALQHKDAEVAHMKACVDMMEAGQPALDEHLVAALKTKDDEAALMMAAKHKELELMAGLLQLREQQIEDFRQLCEAQQLEIQQLKSRSTTADAGTADEGTKSTSALKTDGAIKSLSAPSSGSPVAAGLQDAAAQRNQNETGCLDGGNAIAHAPVDSGVHSTATANTASADAQQNKQLMREVRRLRLRMEELEAAVGDQHDRSAGLALALEAKTERVKALEVQLRSLTSPVGTWMGSECENGVTPLGTSSSCGLAAELRSSTRVSSNRHSSRQGAIVHPVPPLQLSAPMAHTGHRHLESEPLTTSRGESARNSEGLSPHMVQMPPASWSHRGDNVTGHTRPTHGLDSYTSVPASASRMGGRSASTGNLLRTESMPQLRAVHPSNGYNHSQNHNQHHNQIHNQMHNQSNNQQHNQNNNHHSNHHHNHHHDHNLTFIEDGGLHPDRANELGRSYFHEVQAIHPDLPGRTPSNGRIKGHHANDRQVHYRGHGRSEGERAIAVLPDHDIGNPSVSSGTSQVQTYRSAINLDRSHGSREQADAFDRGVGDSATEAAETSRQSQELLMEMRRLRLQMSELERVAGTKNSKRTTARPRVVGNDSLGASVGSSLGGENSTQGDPGFKAGCEPEATPSRLTRRQHQVAALPDATEEMQAYYGNGSWQWPRAMLENAPSGTGSAASSSAARSARSIRSEQSRIPEFAGWEYKPHQSGDPVDAAIASLVNKPGGRYRGWRALLCRLEPGIYLCGTRRVHLRADLQRETIEASDDGCTTWGDLEDLMRGAEACQRTLLERARDAAGLCV